MTTSTRELVQQFYGCIHEQDFAKARGLLHDDLDFQGPIDTFSKADEYLESLAKLGQIVKEVNVLKMFSDGNDTCVIYDLVTNTPIGTAPVAEWFHCKEGKIAAIRVYFDARPFAPLFQSHA